MSGKIKLILLVAILAGICGGIFGYMEFNRTATSTEDLKSELHTDVAQLVKDYEADEMAANEKYLGKIISVGGVVQGIDKSEDGGVSVLLESADGAAMVNGLIEKGKEAAAVNLQPGDKIMIKGSVSGYDDLFTEVKLANCIIAME